LAEILQLAARHPFYNDRVLSGAAKELTLTDFPVMDKKTLYAKLKDCETNVPGFLQGVYLSPSGGSSGQAPLYFATAVKDNWRQRTAFAASLKHLGVFHEGSLNPQSDGPLEVFLTFGPEQIRLLRCSLPGISCTGPLKYSRILSSGVVERP